MFPKRTYHLRIFLISLAVIALSLAMFVFGVRMEAVAPTTGVITAREVIELRALVPGLAEPGWINAQAGSPGAATIPVRLARDGNGLSEATPSDPSRPVRQRELLAGDLKLPVRGEHFHRLQAGDILWPGQPAATIRNDELRFRYEKLNDQIADLEKKGQTASTLERERDRLRQQLAQSTLEAPAGSNAWLVLEAPVAPLQAVKAGDLLATLVAVDPRTHQPRDLIARLDIEERHWGEIAVGEPVRLRSTVHNHRLHGTAEGRIERLEPLGEPGPKGERRFHAIAAITTTPFPLPLGSSCRGEIIVGRKLVYRIILEH
jgi:hypothetical protein